jgi:endonuclease YncB( thermonuclease family)
MTFLRIAIFVVFLIAVFFFRQWLPWSTRGTHEAPVASTQTAGQPVISATATAPPAKSPTSAPTDTLRIDGQLITSIDTIRNFQVVDGDSIRWSTANGVVDYRLASIDAPELNQLFGLRSKKYLQTILAGKELTAYQTGVDRYGRRVAFIFATSPGRPGFAQEINAKMVADGYAWHAVTHSQNDNLARLETVARSSRLGLWEQRAPVAPWNYRNRGSSQSSVASRP